MTKEESAHKTMRGGLGMMDDLPMDEEEPPNAKNSYYEFVEPRFRPPTGGAGKATQ
jgi:hypothetical protein